MKVLFVNDTSAFHCGSRAASECMKRGLSAAGHDVVAEAGPTRIDAEGVDACDAVLVNGEGTLHDDSQRAIRILQLLGMAQDMGKPTAICNASWFRMSNAYDRVLRRLDALQVREARSRDELRAKHGVEAGLALDASYHHSTAAGGEWPARRVRMTDLYWPAIRGFAAPTGGQLAKFELLRMERLAWHEMLGACARSEVLLTGRHHGVYAACRMRTPFVALSGNTPKIEGLAAWAGIDLPVTGNAAELASLVARIGRYRDAFSRLFDWMEAQPRWTSPF